MTGQQYRVVADRDKGDSLLPPRDGDRVTYGRDGWGKLVAVRIERLVPTAEFVDVADDGTPTRADGSLMGEPSDADLFPVPSVPTREQIVDVLSRANVQYQHGAGPDLSRSQYLADAVLALIQKGTDR